MHFSALAKCGKGDRRLRAAVYIMICAVVYTYNTCAEWHWMRGPNIYSRIHLKQFFLYNAKKHVNIKSALMWRACLLYRAMEGI